jgi:phenylalanyl-tRNA synthetase alpha subunit
MDRLALRLRAAEAEKVAAVQAMKDENKTLLSETRERWKAELAAERLRAAQKNERIDVKVAQARKSISLKRDALAAAAG